MAHDTGGGHAVARGGRWRPFVSVVVPTYNEAKHIDECLDSVVGQTYPADLMEVIVADGGSTDATREIVDAVAARDPRVRLIHNPRRTQSAGLNVAITSSRGDVVARLDGHAAWPPLHLERSVDLLDSTGADNVGGSMDARGDTPFGEAVARATRSPFGIGGARFHYATRLTETDTVFLGCFRRSALDRAGLFDEQASPHEDYELNHRIRRTGGRIIFSPDLPVTYWTRATPAALLRQYFRYGRSKFRVARRAPGVVRPYHVVPPMFVLASAAAAVAVVAGHRAMPLTGALLYSTAAGIESLRVGRGAPAAALVLLPAVFPMLHLAWGAGFLAGAGELCVDVTRFSRSRRSTAKLPAR